MTQTPHDADGMPAPSYIHDHGIRKIGAAIVFVTFGVFGTWAVFAPIDGSAVAPGVIVVKSHKKTVQHMDGGIVSKILVKDGDLVTEGLPLLLLDDTQLKSQLEIARSQNIVLAAQVARLEAERDQQKHIEFPEWLSNSADPRAIKAKQTETNVFISRMNAYEGEVALLNQRINQIASKITGLQDQVKSKQLLINSYQEEIIDLQELLKEGFTDKLRLRDVERNHALHSGEIASLKSEIATNQMMISEAKIQILQTQKHFQEQVAEKLSEAQAQLNDAVERVTANLDKLNRVVIKSPASGIVQGLAVHTENGVITAGTPILDIVPQDAELVVDAKVATADIDKVSLGLNAEVRFTAFNQATTPKMDGRVIQISADRFIDEKTDISYYLARIELTEKSRKDLGKLQLMPGMSADVLINTGERTLVEYLAKPFTDALRRSFIED